MKLFLTFYFQLIFLAGNLFSQVPLNEEGTPPPAIPPATQEAEDLNDAPFSLGALTDPEELSLIAGLDDPM